jgi:threonine/homoserine/homoserine lactone efflux protein
LPQDAFLLYLGVQALRTARRGSPVPESPDGAVTPAARQAAGVGSGTVMAALAGRLVPER